MIQKSLILAGALVAILGAATYRLQAAPQASAPRAQTPGAQAAAPVKVAAQPVNKPLYQMSKTEINAWLPTLKKLSLTERMAAVSAREMNTPYFLGPLGEGPKAPFDKDPLIDLSRVDCVTFCEQTLAFALSSNYDQAYETLQKIRYKGGQNPADRLMETRNHYFIADWVQNNSWLVSDITGSLPGHQPMTRTISHKQLFASQNFAGIQVREPDRTLTVQYIPDTKLQGIEKYLKSGDIAILIQDHPGIFEAHTGMMYQLADGRWVFRNATSIGPKKVVDTPWPELITALQQSQRLIGMAFARPRQP